MKSPNVIPPAGPKPGVDDICGEEMECLRLLRCNILGMPGEARGSRVSGLRFAALVFKLSRLGFFRPFRAGGLIKEGDVGAES